MIEFIRFCTSNKLYRRISLLPYNLSLTSVTPISTVGIEFRNLSSVRRKICIKLNIQLYHFSQPYRHTSFSRKKTNTCQNSGFTADQRFIGRHAGTIDHLATRILWNSVNVSRSVVVRAIYSSHRWYLVRLEYSKWFIRPDTRTGPECANRVDAIDRFPLSAW